MEESKNLAQTANSDKLVLAAVNLIYLMAGISEPTKRDKELVIEAIEYANISNYKEEARTQLEWAEKKKFEVMSLAYFMRKKNNNDITAKRYFWEYEQRELNILNGILTHPAFNCC